MERNSDRHSQFESPLRYPGGKACIFPFISKLFYENNLVGSAYAEPYAGGAGLALKLLYNEYVSEIFINDLDKSIYSFWVAMLTQNSRFCNWLENVEVTVENWFHYKSLQENADATAFELAKSTFFLNRTNISGVIKGGIIGGQDQRGKYKIDARFNKSDLIKRIERIQKFRDRIKITNLDGLDFIKRLDKSKNDAFIYIDPPYVQKGADLYMNFYALQDHRLLAESIHFVSKRWLVSYDNHDFILNLYDANQKVRYKMSQSASNRVGDEILVFSDKINFVQAIKNLKDPVHI